MSHKIKHVTIENGFVKNPDRVYYEEQFELLPHQHKDFVLTSGGDTQFKIYQPANTFLKEAYVLCKSAPTITEGNVGITIDTTTFESVGGGDIIIGSSTNIISRNTTMAQNSIVKILPSVSGNELVPVSGTTATSLGHTTSSRILYTNVNTDKSLSDAGNFRLLPVFANTDHSVHHFNPFYILSGTGEPQAAYNVSGGYAGASFSSSSASGDQVIVHPNTTSNHSPLTLGVLNTSRKLEFETSVILPSIATDFSFFTGLKLTATPLVSTDATCQAMFLFGSSTPLIGSGNSFVGNTDGDELYFVYSIGNTSYITKLGLKIVANREYHLKIDINKHRKITIFVNGIQYGLTSTASTYGSTATYDYDESLALTENVSLYPMIGIQNTDTNSRSVIVNYIKCSRESKKI